MTRRVLAAVLFAGLTLSLSACATTGHQGGFGEFTTTYRGYPLHCVGQDVGDNTGVMACDFDRFYAEHPGLARSDSGG